MARVVRVSFWLMLRVSNDHFQMKEVYLVVLDWCEHLHARH
jgi:hypothetical protein